MNGQNRKLLHEGEPDVVGRGRSVSNIRRTVAPSSILNLGRVPIMELSITLAVLILVPPENQKREYEGIELKKFSTFLCCRGKYKLISCADSSIGVATLSIDVKKH